MPAASIIAPVAAALRWALAVRDRILGFVFAACAVVIGWARVAAHVHHLQDVAAGLALGGVAAILAALLAPFVISRTPSGIAMGHKDRTSRTLQR